MFNESGKTISAKALRQNHKNNWFKNSFCPNMYITFFLLTQGEKAANGKEQ